jgi:hypothetical protein
MFISSRYTERKIFPSLGYVAVRGGGKMEMTRGDKTPYALSLPLPPRSSAGWPPCVFVKVNKAWRYLATSKLIHMKAPKLKA